MAFNEALLTKFKNLEFPDFPSKFQLVNKKETRKERFSSIFHLIKIYAKEYTELKEKLLNMLYTFLLVQCKTVFVDSKNEKEDFSKTQTPVKKRTKLLNFLKKGTQKLNGMKKRRNSFDHSTSQINLTEEEPALMYSAKKGSRKNSGSNLTPVLRKNSGLEPLGEKIDDIMGHSSAAEEEVIEDHFQRPEETKEDLSLSAPQEQNIDSFL